MSDTPRTDKFEEAYFGDSTTHVDDVFEFARELERENAALRAALDAQANYQRDLRADRDRLDWLENEGFEHRHHETGDSLGFEWVITSKPEEPRDIRAAIDAAMKEAS